MTAPPDARVQIGTHPLLEDPRISRPSVVAALLSVTALVWPGASHAQTFKVAKYNIGGDGGTDSPPPPPGFRGPRGPVIAAWFFAISH